MLAAVSYWFITTSEPRVEIASTSYPPLKVSFRTSGINGFLRMAFYSETADEHLWDMTTGNFQSIKDVTYGVLPPRSKQDFPLSGKPRDLRVGEKVLVGSMSTIPANETSPTFARVCAACCDAESPLR